jgi:hypothetical protein
MAIAAAAAGSRIFQVTKCDNDYYIWGALGAPGEPDIPFNAATVTVMWLEGGHRSTSSSSRHARARQVSVRLTTNGSWSYYCAA